jgi:hypothetical protein
MKSILCILFVIATFIPSVFSAEERIGLDPVVRGLWKLHVTSQDGGVTLVHSNPPEDFAVVTATTINMGAAGRYTVERVMIVNDDHGNPGNMALLNTGRWLAITKQPGSVFVLVQVFDLSGNTPRELVRWLVTVHN